MALLKKDGRTGILPELVGIFVIPNGVFVIACPELVEEPALSLSLWMTIQGVWLVTNGSTEKTPITSMFQVFL